MPGLYGVVRTAYTVAWFAALFWLLYGGCTAGNVMFVPLVLCLSSCGTLVFLGIRRTTSAREEERRPAPLEASRGAFALNVGLGLYFKAMGLYAGIVPHKHEHNP